MRNPRHFRSSLLALASAVWATLFLVACTQTPAPSSSPAPESKAPTSAVATPAAAQDVYVVFEGPWAIVPDPKDANSVVALAPKSTGHHDLYVAASNHSTLAPGTYDLSVPAHSASATSAYDPSILRAKIDPKDVQSALDKKMGRYAIRLPRPEGYVPASRFRSRVSAAYPPEVATEKEYATAVALRYSVASMTGFSLGGAPDAGAGAAFNPMLLQVDTPTVRFVLDPVQADDVCYAHARMAFHDLVKLVGITLYVDFPGTPSDCHGKDPQNAHPVKAEVERRPFLERVGLGRGSAGGLRQHLLAAIYFFGANPIDCKSPLIVED